MKAFLSAVGGRKNFAYYVTVVSVFFQATLIPRLDTDTILTAGIVFMVSNAAVTVAAEVRSERNRNGRRGTR